MDGSDPVLARTTSSLTQLVLATVPFFLLLTYFLILSFQRTGIYERGEQMKLTLIPLTHMLYVYLSFFFLWTMLFLYLMVFVPNRRKLTESYVTSDNEVVLGDVKFDDTRGRWGCLGNFIAKFGNSDYAYVSYRHKKGFVVKKVRTYSPYDREQVAIILLPNRPKSGQPRCDIQTDAATFPKDRDKSTPILMVCAAWIFLSVLGSSIIVHQLYQIDDPDLEGLTGQDALIWTLCSFVLIPFICYVSNITKFLFYRKWVTNSGKIVDEISQEAKIDKDASIRPYEVSEVCAWQCQDSC